MRRTAILALSLLGLAVAPAAGAEMPPANEEFPPCSDSRVDFCIESFQVDMDRDGTFEAPPATVEARVHLFSSWADTDRDALVVSVVPVGTFPGGGADLGSLLPAGTPIRLAVRVGAWPVPQILGGYVDIRSWTTSVAAGAGTTLGFEFRPTSVNFAANCGWDDLCANPTDLHLTESDAHFVIWGPDPSSFDDLTPEMKAYNLAIWEQMRGMSFGTNALGWGLPPSLNAETGAISFDLIAPHLGADGQPNIGFLSMVMPDAAVRGIWGADPDALAAASGALTAVRRETGQPAESSVVSVTRVEGGVAIRVDGIHFSAPKVTVRPKRILRAPRALTVTRGKKGSHRVSVKVGKVPGAMRYIAQCQRGKRTVTAGSRKRTIVVRNLATGIWKCRGRGAAIIGGAWSAQRAVRAR